ncbi:MAG TPA: methyltransferase domain-containing protein [Pseudolabrys sp.]|nr:methyltransferase domain-containing protein [Pseudolabrys sp.]
MNRKQRRATQKQQQPAGLGPASTSDSVAEMYARAQQHVARREFSAAAHLYKKILALKPGQVAAHDGLGCVYFSQGKMADASRQFAQVAVLAPQILDQFIKVLETLILLIPALGDAIKKASNAWPTILPPEGLLGPAGIAAIAGNIYLRTVLESTIARDIDFERLLTSLRASIAAAAAADPPHGGDDPDFLGFCSALAQQCFINEYVFATSAQELADVERIKALLADAVARGLPVHPLRPIALAMYVALYEMPEMQALAERAWPAPVEAVVTQQLREPNEERRLRALIPRLTPIGDGVTAQVRQQYEENPYPRWVRLADAPRPILLDDHIRHQFPSTPFRQIGEHDRLDILVAGCGTGRHALELAQSYRGAHVLAVDLSLASLASAKRRTPPALADRVEFAQADIFSLASIGRSFDLINVGGVLHHTSDPLGAWRELIKLMKPNGLMQVGLYSAHARRDIIAARAAIAAQGYRSTPDDIRRCRQDLLSTGKKFDYMRLNDFFSVSECRDLLFHVHEQQVTIPEIKSFIAQNGLQFIGFEFFPQDIHVRYRQLFASAGWSTGDLGRWDAVERENPDLFAAMYIFWVQKN